MQTIPEAAQMFQFVKSDQTTSKMQPLLWKISLKMSKTTIQYIHSTAVQLFSLKAQM